MAIGKTLFLGETSSGGGGGLDPGDQEKIDNLPTDTNAELAKKHESFPEYEVTAGDETNGYITLPSSVGTVVAVVKDDVIMSSFDWTLTSPTQIDSAEFLEGSIILVIFKP